MFYILVILGTVFIALGIFLEKRPGLVKQGDKFIDEIYKTEVKDNKDIEKAERDEAKLLEKRIDLLEELLFKKTLEDEVKESVTVKDEKKEDSFEQYQLIKKYEKENKSLDEISKLLKMNKGEVLLLKSLYKNS